MNLAVIYDSLFCYSLKVFFEKISVNLFSYRVTNLVSLRNDTKTHPMSDCTYQEEQLWFHAFALLEEETSIRNKNCHKNRIYLKQIIWIFELVTTQTQKLKTHALQRTPPRTYVAHTHVLHGWY